MLANLARQKVRNDRQFEASLDELHQEYRSQLNSLGERYFAREFKSSCFFTPPYDPLSALPIRPTLSISSRMHYTHSGEANGIRRAFKEKLKDDFSVHTYHRAVLHTRFLSLAIPLLVVSIGWLGLSFMRVVHA